jgi:hypothetical protein
VDEDRPDFELAPGTEGDVPTTGDVTPVGPPTPQPTTEPG